jgi:hypothetical protein
VLMPPSLNRPPSEGKRPPSPVSVLIKLETPPSPNNALAAAVEEAPVSWHGPQVPSGWQDLAAVRLQNSETEQSSSQLIWVPGMQVQFVLSGGGVSPQSNTWPSHSPQLLNSLLPLQRCVPSRHFPVLRLALGPIQHGTLSACWQGACHFERQIRVAHLGARRHR